MRQEREARGMMSVGSLACLLSLLCFPPCLPARPLVWLNVAIGYVSGYVCRVCVIVCRVYVRVCVRVFNTLA